MSPLHPQQAQIRKLYTNKNLSCAKNTWKKGYVHMEIDANLHMDLMNLDKITAKIVNTKQNNAWFI